MKVFIAVDMDGCAGLTCWNKIPQELEQKVENFPGKFSPFITASDFLEAQKEIPQLCLTYDNGNAASGENPVDSFKKCAPYVVHAGYNCGKSE